MDTRESEYRKIIERLESLEARLSVVESELGSKVPERQLPGPETNRPDGPYTSSDVIDYEKGLESQIGRIGLAWLGSIVMLFAIIFFTEYLLKLDSKGLAYIIGYCSVATIFIIAGYLKKSGSNLPSMFNLVGFVTVFYVTLRLHFFSTDPFLSSRSVAIFLLLIIIVFQIILALKNKSEVYGFLSIVFLLFTAIMSDSTHVMLPLVSISAVAAVYYLYKHNWKIIFSFTVFAAYLVYFMWFFSNPVMGHEFQLITRHNYGFIYLFLIGAYFCSLPLLRKEDGSNNDFVIAGIIINGLLFTFLLSLVTISFFRTNYVALFAAITVSCLGYSVLLKKRSDWNFASAFFALYGFMAMSISLYGLVGLPKVYLLLSLQSLVVVAMALWFRNRLMIYMNSLLFFTILLAYLFLSKSSNGVNFSFAIVSLVSARVINWQKERLSIRTEYIRNLYLIEGFIMVLFALYQSVPGQFITLSWTGAALIHFLLSFVLKNVKYRYMALGTMICATIYLFIVDLARIDLIYRVLALLFLAIVSIGISIYYTNRGKKEVR
jgi:hypothetical protein